MIVNFFEAAANFQVQPLEAIDYFTGKGLKATYNWHEMLNADHDAAFTIAKMMDTDLLMTVKQELRKTIDNGGTLEDFKKELIPTLQKRGWWGKKDVIDPATGHVTKVQLGSASRLENIFRTNMQSSYSAGHWQAIKENEANMPYLMYDAVDDNRTRPLHASWDGLVLPISDPFWDTNYPLNGWLCRCGVIQMDEDDLKEHGLSVSESPAIETQKWIDPNTGKVHYIPKGVDPGFAHNPGKSQHAKLAQLQKDKLAKIAKTDEEAAKAATKGAAATEAKAKATKNAQESAAEAQLTVIAAGNAAKQAKLKQKALEAAQKSGKADELTKQELLDHVIQTAADKQQKAELSSALSGYKKSAIAGKTPSPKQQKAYDSLPDEAQLGIKADIDIKTGNAAAAEELANIAAGKAAVQTKLKQKILAKWDKDGSTDSYPSKKSLLEAIEAEAAKQQAKAQKTSVLSGYKKKAIAGKIPTKKQQEVFDGLSEPEKAKVLAAIDDAKPKAKAGTLTNEGTKSPPGQLSEVQKQAAAKIELEHVMDADPVMAATMETLEDLSEEFDPYDYIGNLEALKEMASDAGHPWPNIPASVTTKATRAAKATKAAPTPEAIDLDDFIKVGGQGGSNPGGTYQHKETGKRYYIKHMNDAERAQSEVLAAKLYKEAGIEVAEVNYIKQASGHHSNKHHVLSEIIDDLTEDAAKLKAGQVEGATDGFAIDAWLANWDVVGLEFDNMLVKGGRAIRIDTGGALNYRAQGTKKGAKFSNKVAELETFMDADLNPRTAVVFGNMTKSEIAASAARLEKLDSQKITELVNKYSGGSAAEKAKLAKKLIARRADILKKYPAMTEAAKKAKAAAVESKMFVVTDKVDTMDHEILTAIKGIYHRQDMGEALQQKDIDRVKAALKTYSNIMDDDEISEAYKLNLAQHYQQWFDDMQAAIYDDIQMPKGKFAGLKVTPVIDEGRIKYTVPDPTKPQMMNEAKAKSIIVKFGGTMEAASSVGNHGTQAAFERLSLSHKRAIAMYTGHHYRALNRSLYQRDATPEQLQFKALLNEALDNSDPYKGISTRGLELHGDALENWIQGHTKALQQQLPVRHLSFISSTKGSRSAFGGNLRVVIEGENGVWVNPISRNHGRENEVLFKADSTFLVTNIKENDGKYRATIYLKEVTGVSIDKDLEFSE